MRKVSLHGRGLHKRGERKRRRWNTVSALAACAIVPFMLTDGYANAESDTLDAIAAEEEAGIVDVEETLEESPVIEQEVVEEEFEFVVDEPEFVEPETDQEPVVEEDVLEEEDQVLEGVEEEVEVSEPVVEEPEPVTPVEEDQEENVDSGAPAPSEPTPPFHGDWELIEVDYDLWIPTGPAPDSWTEAEAERWIAYWESLSEEELTLWFLHLSEDWLDYFLEMLWWYYDLDDIDWDWDEDCWDEGGAPVDGGASPVKESKPVQSQPVAYTPEIVKSVDSTVESGGERLPDTSTNIYNFGFAGLLALLLGAMLRFRRVSAS
ncbi:hypothetical protein ACE1TF_14950 [Geomicrobium sp. JSM 1781026]